MGLHRGPRAGPSQGTGPFLPCSGGSRDEQGRSEFGPKSVSSPASPGQVARVWDVLQKKKKKKTSLYSPRKFCPLFQTHSSRPDEERGGGGKSFGAFSRTKLKDPTLGPPPSPSLGRASAQSRSSPQTDTQRGPETPPSYLPATRRKTGAAAHRELALFRSAIQKHAGSDAIRRIM